MLDDEAKLECGVTLLFMRKPISYYPENYAIDKTLFMLSELEHRGQDSGGLTGVNVDAEKGAEYMWTATAPGPTENLKLKLTEDRYDGIHYVRLVSGQRRYTTFASKAGEQPMERPHSRPTKRFSVSWNGNFSNTMELEQRIEGYGYRKRTDTDTELIVSDLAFSIKQEHDRLERAQKSNDQLDLVRILSSASQNWQGAYTLAVVFANGDAFFANDPHGLRPAHYAVTDDVIVAASENGVITQCFDVHPKDVICLEPAHMLVIKNNGSHYICQFTEPKKRKHCQFEFVYFAHPSSKLWGKEVYQTRRNLGASLAERLYEKIKHHNPKDIVVVPVPETSRPAAISVARELGNLFDQEIEYGEGLIKSRTAGRTFIASHEEREEKVKYYTIYSELEEKVVITVEDSIVRGTTFKKGAIKRVKDAKPKEIHAVISCPQLRHLCCYGIDMAEYGEFIAFIAMRRLLKEKGLENELTAAYEQAEKQQDQEAPKILLEKIYSLVSVEEISDKIAEIIGVDSATYQTVDGLKEAIGLGDDICTACLDGKYPEPGGLRVANQGLIDCIEGKKGRAYD